MRKLLAVVGVLVIGVAACEQPLSVSSESMPVQPRGDLYVPWMEGNEAETTASSWTVNIGGPHYTQPNYWCHWTAYVADHIPRPLSFSWDVEGDATYSASGAHLQAHPNSLGFLYITVTVTDGSNDTHQAWRYVDVMPNVPVCFP
jgi:hypothetical protein